MRRYIRAFFITLRMTLRGETLQPTPLQVWMSLAQTRLGTVHQAAADQGIDPASITLRIDRRDITMKTILDTIQFHLEHEYPHILTRFASGGLNVVYASNFDDHYRLTRLENAPELADTPVQEALTALSVHLKAVPLQENE